MQYFYDLSQKAFLVQGIHNIPQSAIPVLEKDYQLLISGRNNGREIVLMGNTLTLSSVRPSSYHTWTGTAWSISDEDKQVLLSQQQEQMRLAINTKRDQTDAGGVFVEALGKWVDSDEKAYQNILGVKASLDLLGDMDIPWTWADNTTSIINRTMLAVIVGALLQAKQQNHANALKHKKAMMAEDNPLDYDYSQGWSKTYADHLAEVGNE
ncbi:tail fiber assembly protein [Bibersteinia trehalosi Y31]|uniref:Tail fiber assembly protein n=1 Tax=Bibersteinia trehalosi Y31 TaxID=1261658 RepID=A0A179CYQ2_BIBTR|nr:DUF4376 domain-containing protein [Bibersteinia trehalosi]OAQ15036.1 tail fiber assembly protein [Bibersteinia trehalosi Y31]